MVARCGEVRVRHWAHKGRRLCDPWWENETEWHRAWKDQFPADWQEVVCYAEDGERHIADVKTHAGWVIELGQRAKRKGLIADKKKPHQRAMRRCGLWSGAYLGSDQP